ncbi:MAG: hypothetical protein A2161_22195 [Candidatus Schekmanbacteria bacterium RBG_13_48_7]|uniref:Uncharacterized protein n=1 Tax=Candidatus Schekmanbacteria bacterium RBG_13_48_7 TaxID=1817878 RepID=A0A1F7RYB7_9BACT|nr:MAG: hypothetical protein A2161_22195 [Candidatus Schekmanbacteria bacterium RBG_13_48_7]
MIRKSTTRVSALKKPETMLTRNAMDPRGKKIKGLTNITNNGKLGECGSPVLARAVIISPSSNQYTEGAVEDMKNTKKKINIRK